MTPTTMNFYPNNPAKARAAMHAMALRGDLPGCAPVGYKNVTANYQKKVIIDQEKAKLVRLAFGMAAAKDRALRSILQELTAYGLM